MEENIIDYGSVTVPSSWKEITLKKYQDIEKYYQDKESDFNTMDVLDILIDKDRDFIMSLPSEFLEIILDKLSFLATTPEVKEPSNKIIIDKVEYSIAFQNKLKTGEYVAVDTVLKSDPHNYAAILAILCRRDGEIYDTKFENEVLDDRIKLFENQPMVDIFPILSFFLSCYMALESLSLLYSKVDESLNLTAENIQNLRKNGDLSILSTKLLMRKLRKLRKSISNI